MRRNGAWWVGGKVFGWLGKASGVRCELCVVRCEV